MPDSDLIKSVGIHLRTMRKSAGFKSAKAFAEYAGIPAAKYTEYEQGRRSMPFDVAWQISQALGCTMDELGGRETPRRAVAPALAADERELLGDYRSLDPPGRETARAQVRLLAELQAKSAAPPSSSSTAAAESA